MSPPFHDYVSEQSPPVEPSSAALLWEGTCDGVKSAAAGETAGSTAAKIGIGAAMGCGMSLLYRQSGALGIAARVIGTGFGLSFLSDAANRYVAVSEALRHKYDYDESKQKIADAVGPFVIDGALMSVGGGMGAGLARVPRIESVLMENYVNAAARFPIGPIAWRNKLLLDLKQHSPIMHAHSVRMSKWAELVGPEVGVPRWEGTHAALLHDAGKIRTPLSILHGKTPLEGQNLQVMRNHVVDSAQFVGKYIKLPSPFRRAVEGIAQHHEALDGSGYPRGLRGDQINEVGRMLRVIDVFDSVTSVDRTYVTRKPLPKVLEIMEAERGTKMDPRMVDALFRQPASAALRIMESAPTRPALPDVTPLNNISLGRVLEISAKRNGSAGETNLAALFERIYTTASVPGT